MARAEGVVPVAVAGLGEIGSAIIRAALSSPEVELVGAVDPDPKWSGRKLSDAIPGAPAVAISQRLSEAFGGERGGVLLQATSSRLPAVVEQLREAMRAGWSVVSTCEELAFPHLRHPELSDALDSEAKAAKVSVLGTGVNPGFVLDRLVAVAGAAVGPVRHVTATRVVDLSTRREALRRKVGLGLSEEAFLQGVDEEKLGHVGLLESCALAALGVGLDCDDFEEEIGPVLADEDAEGLSKGQVAGLHQVARALEDGVERVRLELTMAWGAEAGDAIELEADPPVRLEIPGGIAGDSATANLVVNAAPRVAASEPGLLTVLELPAGR